MKIVTIEWRHLVEDGNTCVRCSDTGNALDAVIERLSEECRESGCQIHFTDTPLGADEIAQSNIILIDGIPIEGILPNAAVDESHCESCCEMIGQPVNCRTIEFGGNRYEAIPESMIREAVCRIADCC